MPSRALCSALFGALTLWLLAARPDARSAEAGFRPGADAVALREFLEGTRGHREAWQTTPELIVLRSVMEYGSADITSGYVARAERLTDDEIGRLISDLTHALAELTDGKLATFSAVRVELVPAGQRVKVFRPGQVVAGRFRGVQAKTGSLGYSGRMTRGATITAAAVILDRDFDHNSDRRRLLRTHELGHALGYNHVESCPSFMNPRIGSGITGFDRGAIKLASTHFGSQ